AQVDIGNLRGPVMWCDDTAAIPLLKLGNAADMVAMVMRDQDVREFPSLGFQRLDDGAGLRCIDRGGRAGFAIVDQIAEIVAQASKDADIGGHGLPLRTAQAAEILR